MCARVYERARAAWPRFDVDEMADVQRASQGANGESAEPERLVTLLGAILAAPPLAPHWHPWGGLEAAWVWLVAFVRRIDEEPAPGVLVLLTSFLARVGDPLIARYGVKVVDLVAVATRAACRAQGLRPGVLRKLVAWVGAA